jgi:hypothetical protein
MNKKQTLNFRFVRRGYRGEWRTLIGYFGIPEYRESTEVLEIDERVLKNKTMREKLIKNIKSYETN